MLTTLNVVSRIISSVSSVTFGEALRVMCIDVYMCMNTHYLQEIFSNGKFFYFIYLFLESYQSVKSYNNVI